MALQLSLQNLITCYNDIGRFNVKSNTMLYIKERIPYSLLSMYCMIFFFFIAVALFIEKNASVLLKSDQIFNCLKPLISLRKIKQMPCLLPMGEKIKIVSFTLIVGPDGH